MTRRRPAGGFTLVEVLAALLVLSVVLVVVTRALVGARLAADGASTRADAARLLERELSKEGYQARTIAIGTNTDPYQPIEKERRITRAASSRRSDAVACCSMLAMPRMP